MERAAAALQLLASRNGRLGLVDIASSLGLARGTAHGILRTSYLDVNELRSGAINWADPLAARSGAAVRLGTMHDRRVLVVTSLVQWFRDGLEARPAASSSG
jgi:hypothetical protein